MLRVAVIGLGYVGLTTAVCFAEKRIPVIGHDIDENKLEMLSKNQPTFFEKGLKKKLKHGLKSKFLDFTSSYEKAIKKSDVIFVTVGTPSKKEGNVDLSYIKSSVSDIGKCIADSKKFKVIAIKSTVNPGCMNKIVKPILEANSNKKSGKGFGVCSNPEFLKEGSSIFDTLHPDRIVLGTEDDTTRKIMLKLYKKMYGNAKIRFVNTNPTNAEFIKYVNNAFLAMKISFINTVANICQKTPDADIQQIAQGIGLDNRINPKFLNAGLGYGGSCFPKDVKGLIGYANSIGAESGLLKQVNIANELQPMKAIELAESLIGNINQKTISILGLSFKPNTDDLREAVSLKIIRFLLTKNCIVRVHDPMAMLKVQEVFGRKIYYSKSISDCLKNSECCIIITEWGEYTKLIPKDFEKNMKKVAIVDGRRIFNPKTFSKVKFAAIGLTK